eukprot:SAG31_NODE_4424_length_3246_cov_1.533524_2_plen_154_part_00
MKLTDGSNSIPQLSAPSGASYAVAMSDIVAVWTTYYVALLPRCILEIASTEPTSTLAASCRRWIRRALFPQVHAIAEVFKTQSAVMEWPSHDWMIEHFPNSKIQIVGSRGFAEVWIALAESFEAIFEAWDADELSKVAPAYPLPVSALSTCIE